MGQAFNATLPAFYNGGAWRDHERGRNRRLNALIKLMRIFLASTARWITTTSEFRSTFRLHQSLMLAEQRASTSDAMNFQDNPGISPVPFQTRSGPQFKEYQVDIKFSLNIKHCLWSNKSFEINKFERTYYSFCILLVNIRFHSKSPVVAVNYVFDWAKPISLSGIDMIQLIKTIASSNCYVNVSYLNSNSVKNGKIATTIIEEPCSFASMRTRNQ